MRHEQALAQELDATTALQGAFRRRQPRNDYQMQQTINDERQTLENEMNSARILGNAFKNTSKRKQASSKIWGAMKSAQERQKAMKTYNDRKEERDNPVNWINNQLSNIGERLNEINPLIGVWGTALSLFGNSDRQKLISEQRALVQKAEELKLQKEALEKVPTPPPSPPKPKKKKKSPSPEEEDIYEGYIRPPEPQSQGFVTYPDEKGLSRYLIDKARMERAGRRRVPILPSYSKEDIDDMNIQNTERILEDIGFWDERGLIEPRKDKGDSYEKLAHKIYKQHQRLLKEKKTGKMPNKPGKKKEGSGLKSIIKKRKMPKLTETEKMKDRARLVVSQIQAGNTNPKLITEVNRLYKKLYKIDNAFSLLKK